MTGGESAERGLTALGDFVVGDTTVEEALQRIVGLAAVAVPPVKYTGITMLVDDDVQTSVFNDPDVLLIDQAQYDSGDGPCLETFREGVPHVIASTRTAERWPTFCRTARDHGVHSTLSLPLLAGSSPLGSLNLYSEVEHAFADADRSAAESLASVAAVVLAHAQAYRDARALSEHLTEAMASRATIEQAKGIVMAQSRVDPDTAFDLLRKASQRENRKLRDIARELVERHSVKAADAGRRRDHAGGG